MYNNYIHLHIVCNDLCIMKHVINYYCGYTPTKYNMIL